MTRLSGNLFVEFATVSLLAMVALAILLSAVLTTKLSRNVELLEDHGAAMTSGTMIKPEDPYSIPSLTAHIQNVRLMVYGSVAGALALLYALLTGIVWRGWKTIVRSREALSEGNHRLEETLTELQQTQTRVVQQERLQALGTLSSGIAHDFNNAPDTDLGVQ